MIFPGIGADTLVGNGEYLTAQQLPVILGEGIVLVDDLVDGLPLTTAELPVGKGALKNLNQLVQVLHLDSKYSINDSK